MLDETLDAALIAKLVTFARALILDADADLPVEERQLSQTLAQHIKAVFNELENGSISLEGNFGARLAGFANGRQGCFGIPSLVFLLPNFAVAANLQHEVLAQGVDHADADSMQTARDFVGFRLKFAACVQGGHDHLRRGLPFGLVQVHRDTTPVVFHGNAFVGVDDNLDGVAIAGQGLIDGVVHHFVNQVVQTIFRG